ncbi:PP2C family protein-serine/threonine phosphatase [Streptomyces tsukubensis]|uniref:PP2C family protein-serine/threonine phosphatase n=1 Tax=Streptomyces tsukubensis TaxID=83656 RepID=UPI0036C71D75
MIRSSSARPRPGPPRAGRPRAHGPAAARARPGAIRPLRRLLPFGLPVACAAAALVGRVVMPHDHPESLAERIVAALVLLTVGTAVVIGARRRLRRELRRARAVAHATQSVLLRPPPARLEGLSLAAGQLSASRGAIVGGDLYEAVATPYGVRAVIGDVRGHGLPAIGAVAAVLGSFREAAHDEAELGGLLRRLDRAVQRHLRERARDEHPAASGSDPENPSAEEFVTLLLLEIDQDCGVRALNCGHPWPYRLGPGGARPLAAAEPLPPLGPFPLPAVLDPYLAEPLGPGEDLLLHTDGAVEARDARGRFFGLRTALERIAAAPPAPPAAVIATLRAALLRHTGGRPGDDVALLLLRNDRHDRAASTGKEARGSRTGEPAGTPAAEPPAVVPAAPVRH